MLTQHKVEALFHANTVLTSISFLKNQGLCSRQYISRLVDSYQTSQCSDSNDQAVGVYNDIFFDSVDIHNRRKEYNKYGPVLFVYSLDLLSEPELESKILITKDNPIWWNPQMNFEDRYFADFEELQRGFHKGTFKQHITLHNVDKVGFKYLQSIILDTLPKEYDDVFENSYLTLQKAVKEADLSIDVSVRQCESSCKCLNKYLQSSRSDIIKKYFV